MSTDQILLIHTVPSVRKFLEVRVKANGYDVATAANTTEAARILSSLVMDVIICDNAALKGSGADFLEWVQEQVPGVAVVVLSSWADLETALEGLERALNVTDRLNRRPHFEIDTEKKPRAPIQEMIESEAVSALERQYPGITRVRRDANGFLILGDR